MRPGAIQRELMSFARLRPQGDLSAKLSELNSIVQKMIAAHTKRRDRHREDRMQLVSLELSRLLFYHAPRTGPEFNDDGIDTFSIWETYTFNDDVYKRMIQIVEETETMIRALYVRWGSPAAGAVADLALRLLGSDRAATATPNMDRFTLKFDTGEYYSNEPFQPERQAAGWRAAIEGVGASIHFTDREVSGVSMPVFGPAVITRPARYGGGTAADIDVSGRSFSFGFLDEMLLGKGEKFQAHLFTRELRSTREGLELLNTVMTKVSQALGQPSDITIDFSVLTSELETYAEPLGRIGKIFPLSSVLMDYRRGFKPLAPQSLNGTEIRAYPLLILRRYAEGIAPI